MKSMPRLAAILTTIAGAIMIIAGAFTYQQVSTHLAAENITVSKDAACQAGQAVNGPYEAWCMADIIQTHALKATEGKTYAELDKEDPKRAVAMNASFLRSSLFTSVLAFGVSAMAVGVGFILVLVGLGLSALDRRTQVAVEAPEAATV